jgi:hypothetical protein
MKPVLLWMSGALLALAAVPASAKSCEELKSEIEARIQANGVSLFVLEVVDAAAAKGQKVVGSCEGGTKKVTYMRP